MISKRITLLISINIILLLLTACDKKTVIDTTAIAAQVITSVAETVAAIPTNTPEPTATETPTPTATPTETPTPTPSSTNSLNTGINNSLTGATTQTNTCDNSTFLSDVNISDGTQFAPGTAFTKTWRLRNSGTCTWNSEYAIIFLDGNNMSGGSPHKLSGITVAPGDVVDISINLVAPSQEGTYTGYWRMQNASRITFGHTFYVQIKVGTGIQTGSPTPISSVNTLTPTNTSIPPTDTTTPTATEETPTTP
ncbi:MAG: NBR1-Ig-like domain-containing protein [Anaerolineaceae bacterium]|nr:NBR1-Ig-like domain-containing protein [Anaerolineaceae bacterium]